MTTQPQARLTPEEYLRMERDTEWKSEYIDGEMFAMSGASPDHVLIATNIAGELRVRLRGGPSTVYTADLRVTTDPQRHYAYPDVVVICGPREYTDERRDTITNPKLIVEVLSSSTENYDRGAKFERYRAMHTLAEYMLVAQDRIHVELYTRQPDDRWLLREWNEPTEIELASLDCRLSIAEVYANVQFSG